MTINAVGGATGTSAPTSPTTPSSAQSGTGLGTDAFLKLLVAQLKYQDPMNPAQGTEFLTQTAQFTMVEKLTELAQQNADALAGQRALQAGSMVGRTVTWTADDGSSKSGVVTSAHLLPAGPVLKVGDQDVPLTAVTEVAQAPAPPASSTPTTSS